MTKEEIKKEIAECEEKLHSLREKLDKPEYGGKRWKPEKNERYYYICTDGDVFTLTCTEYEFFAKNLFAIGNCFKTEEEAEFELERRKVIAELSDFAEGDEAVWDKKTLHWYICYSFSDKEISYGFRFMYKNAQLYFPSEEAAKAAVKAVGEERVKKYYLGVME